MLDSNNPSDRSCTIRYHEVAETWHPDTRNPIAAPLLVWVMEKVDPPDCQTGDGSECYHPSKITERYNPVTGCGEISVGAGETIRTMGSKEAGVIVRTSHWMAGEGKEEKRIHKLTEITSYNGWRNIGDTRGGDGVSVSGEVAAEVTKADTAKTGP